MIQLVKIPFPNLRDFILYLPVESRILSVQIEHDAPHLWIMEDLSEIKNSEYRYFIVYHIGDDIFPEPLNFIAAFQIPGSWYCHFFERVSQKKAYL